MTAGELRRVLMAVDEDAGSLAEVGGELEKRYGADYEILRSASPRHGLSALSDLAESGRQVVIVLADVRLEELSWQEFLPARVAGLHPGAKRVLAVEPWADSAAVIEMMVEALG